MEVFTPAQLQQLDNVFMYLAYENDVPYQNSMYEAVRDDGTEPDDDEPESTGDTKEYYILNQMHRKLFIMKNFLMISSLIPSILVTTPIV